MVGAADFADLSDRLTRAMRGRSWSAVATLRDELERLAGREPRNPATDPPRPPDLDEGVSIHYDSEDTGGGGEWAALYVDGRLVEVGDSSNVEERAFAVLGVNLIQDSAFMRGQHQYDGVARTLEEVRRYREERRQRQARAAELRRQAADLERQAADLLASDTSTRPGGPR